jgi:ABC-type polysaccharide transport system permease subunit
VQEKTFIVWNTATEFNEFVMLSALNEITSALIQERLIELAQQHVSATFSVIPHF